MKRASTLVIVSMMLAAGVTSWAQTTTGRLIGNAVDEAGAPLPGVVVTIASPALIGGAQTRVTDARGEYSFVGIAPGEYTVQATLSGFITQERAQVKVPLGGAASMIIAMPAGTFTGEINVMDETPVVDPTQVNTGQVFDQRYMEDSAIGSTNRDYLVVVNQAAGVTSGSWGSPQSKVFGSTIGENAYFIDGMDTTDPATATANVRMNFDAVDEIQLLTGGFEAEHGRATGGIINLVTRSGGNDFSGVADLRFRDGSFQESGDHFDASEQESSFEQYSFTLGGPIRRDRLWFFASYQWIDDEFTPIESPSTRDREAQNYLTKLTWQAHPSWRVVGKYSSDPYTEDNSNASRWVMAEATALDDSATTVVSAELSAVLSESLLWNTTVGRYELDSNYYPQSGDLQTIGHYNYDTGMSTDNYGNQQYWVSRRDDLSTDLTWFVDDLAGSHELKGGIERSDIQLSVEFCSTGTPNGEGCIPGGVGFFFEDVQYEEEALPYLMWESYNAGRTEYKGVVSTAFVQDAWRVISDLTLKLGFRYDAVSYDINTGMEIADMAMLQPRLGFAWDIAGDARSVLRGSWGRFLHPNALTLPWHARAVDEPSNRWYSCSGVLPLFFEIPVGSADECAAAATDLGWGYRNDNAGWDPYGWVLSPDERYSSEPSQADADISATYADQLILAFERELGPRSAIELSYVDKSTRDIVDDTCNGNLPNPSAGAACDYWVLANIPALRRDYQAAILRFETRSLDWLTLLASYTWSESKGSIEYTQNAGTDFDHYPWHFDNRYGFLSDHREHRFKLNGFVTLHGDWSIAFDGFWSSPFTWTPYEDSNDDLEIPYGEHFLEPRGSRDGRNQYQLDLQLTKGFTVGPVRLALIGSASNVFSDELPTAVCQHVSGCGFEEDGSPITMGDPTDWQTPRRYELGFRVEF
jgi:hypothetical protein